MANRFPLVVDTTDNNKIKELPVGDNLNLSGSGIVNAASIQTDGTLTANNVVVNGQQLSAVALSGNYADLNGAPTGFSGSYNDLVNKPSIPSSTRTLTDVQDIEPANGNILQWNSITGRYEPSAVEVSFDLGNYTLGDIGNVIAVGDTTNKWLKYYSGAWRPASILYSDIQGTPTIPTVPTALSELTNDVGFITSETDSQTLSLVGTELTISNGNTVDLASIVGDTVGNFTLAASVIDTDDSSAITITPAVTVSSDLTVENSLTVNNNLTVLGTLEAQSFGSSGTGSSEIVSGSNLELTAANAVVVTSSPLRMASFTTTERDALAAQNGDIIYNTTDNKFQGYENGAWVNLV